MLKFVTTKNFKMPSNHRMVGLKVKRDALGCLVQTEHWRESVLIPGAHGDGSKTVDVPYTKTYTTVTDKNRMKTISEDIQSFFYPSDEMQNIAIASQSARTPKSQGAVPKPVCWSGRMETIAEAVKESKIASKIGSSSHLPVVIGSTQVNGTVYGTLCQRNARHHNLTGLPNLCKNKTPFTSAGSKPKLPQVESFLKIYDRSLALMIDQLGSEFGEVIEDTPVKSVRDYARTLNQQSLKESPSASKKTVRSFVHKVTSPSRVQLTSR